MTMKLKNIRSWAGKYTLTATATIQKETQMAMIKIQKGDKTKSVSPEQVSHYTDRFWTVVEDTATKQPAASKSFKKKDDEEKVDNDDNVIKGE